MQREEERERRRLRDRQRRQAMTQEQRERHLARRRRNYQLRRQRAANAPFVPLPRPQALESCAGEASTSDELQWVTSSAPISDYTVLHHGLNQGQQTFNLGTEIVGVQPIGSSIQLEAQADNPTNLPRSMRLNHIKRLARNLMRPMGGPTGNHQVAAELIAKGDVTVGDGSTVKPLRLNRVKRLARSISSHSKETAAQKTHNGTVEVEQNVTQSSIQSLGNESCAASILSSEVQANGSLKAFSASHGF